MNISSPFVARPVATILLTIAILLAGALAYVHLPVAPLPQVDFPTIVVQAQLPGASPDTVATSLTAPLERHLGQIADVTEMTSQSQVGQTRIVLQFALSRDINGAARDVQAAINAAEADLPSNLLAQPVYRKVNPADSPVVILALTSKTLTRGQMYDAASTVMQQQLSQLPGVGEVLLNGSALPAVRVELDPEALFHYGISLEDVRSALANANANAPKGTIDIGSRRWQIYTNDQSSQAADYKRLIIAYRNGDAVSLQALGEVADSVQDLRNMGLANGKPAVLVVVFRQPGANIVTTVDSVRGAIPRLRMALPRDVNIEVAMDQSVTIRASLANTRSTLLIAMMLVIAVVFLFLRNGRATIVPAIVVPVSIIGTFGMMYLLGYSLDNLSLMALTIATGFVVDDAIVVVENISRRLEEGIAPKKAALIGAGEVGFTVLSITASLIAVFLPILLMGGIIGRLFQEFAMTLSLAIVISMIVSLTTTPMLCSLLLRRIGVRDTKHSWFERIRDGYSRSLSKALDHASIVLVVLFLVIVLNIWLILLIPKGFFPEEDTGRLMGNIQADQNISFQMMSSKVTRMMSIVEHDNAVQSIVGYTGAGSGGGGSQTNTGSVYVSLKPLDKRDSMAVVIARLRRKLDTIPGARLFLRAGQDIRVGGRSSNSEYQYSVLGDNVAEVYEWAPKLMAAMQKDPTFADVNSDQQEGGDETNLTVDRDSASRLGVTMYQLDNTLYDAFGQRSVSTIYSALNQYHVVMEVAPQYWQHPSTLDHIWISTSGAQPSGSATTQLGGGAVSVPAPLKETYAIAPGARVALSSAADSASNASTEVKVNPTILSFNPTVVSSNVNVLGEGLSRTTGSSDTVSGSANTSAANNAVRTAAQASLGATGKAISSTGAAVATSVEKMIPLSAIARYNQANTALAVNHQSGYVATTISFNLQPGKSLSDAQTAISRDSRQVGMPSDLVGGFAGTALVYEQSLGNETMLVISALAAIYIVLGILYESFVHPITIMSTLPSAGVGAFLALIIFGIQFTIIALIGVVLLLGIVKKNAILMIDFALKAERQDGMDSREAILAAAALRFRPIMMTTTAAMLGALPLCLNFGTGSELRQPLGISIIGGLVVSQVLTLYTTPAVYLALDRVRLRVNRAAGRGNSGRPIQPVTA